MMASSSMTIPLFNKFVEKELISTEDANAILKQVHHDMARGMNAGSLDLTVIEAEEIISSLYANLNGSACRDRTCNATATRGSRD